MKKILIVLLLLTTSLFAQYTQDDYELVKTTFMRAFDTNTVYGYLDADDEDKIKAGLLSLSHSEDTTHVDKITSLDFNEYGGYIAFALGQIGESRKSTQFLLGKIKDGTAGKHVVECYEALGKTGTEETLVMLLDMYEEKSGMHYMGLPRGIANFNLRGINADSTKLVSVLANELKNDSKACNFDALYALYRTGGSNELNGMLVDILKLEDTPENAQLKLYALGCLRRTNSFPADFGILQSVLGSDDWRVRVEAAKAVVNYDFKNEEELAAYLNLLTDNNPNVSRQAAISVSGIDVNEELKSFIMNKVYVYLNDERLTDNTRGELYVNFTRMSESNLFDLLNEFEGKVENEFLFRAASANTDNAAAKYKYLRNKLTGVEERDFVFLFNAIYSLQEMLYEHKDFNELTVSTITAEYAPLVSTTAVWIDSTTIANNINPIQQNILDQCFDKLNDEDYFQNLRWLEYLSSRIDSTFNTEVLNVLVTSEYEKMKTYAKGRLLERDNMSPMAVPYFDELWDKAFEYRQAIVNTSAGPITIEFTPYLAPVSVGNFCYLAEQDYFDGIVFHRVVPNFVIQGGCPIGTGWGGPGYAIPSETSLAPYAEGAVGMASAGKDTEGSQWFVMHSRYPHLNGRYSVWGKVTNGMSVVNVIDQNDVIESVELIK